MLYLVRSSIVFGVMKGVSILVLQFLKVVSCRKE